MIAPDRLTLPQMLQRHGYTTACIGKWHLGWKWPTKDGKPPRVGPDHLSNVDFNRPIAEGPTTRGFDYYFGTCVPNYPPYCFIENDRTVGLPSEPSTEFEFPGPKAPGWKQEHILPELTRRAVQYVEKAGRSRRPFFLYFALTSPHHPVLPTAEFHGKSAAGEYGDFVVQTDWTVGQVLAALERAGLARDTLVIFTSDNGPEITRMNNLGTKNVMPVGAYDRIRQYGHASMGPLRGIKYETWEGGHRVPFIVRWPGRIAAGAVTGELACLTDLFATCAAAIGVETPAGAAVDSWNLLPVLLSRQGGRRSGVFESAALPLAVRRGDWIWINSNRSLRPEPEWFQRQRGYAPDSHPGQLYNLREDLPQRYNRFAEQPGTVRELTILLENIKAVGRGGPVALP